MKIYILFELKKGATGGGNQFLKAIKDYFIKVNSYTEIVDDADVVLYNSYQFIPELIKIKKQYPNKVYIHRIDGPIRLYNTMDDRRDFVINDANELIADGTIFQSNWSRNKNFELGIKNNKFETMILNAPNPKIFNLSNKKKFSKNGKIKLIATSWSSNWKKGFEIYKWLDNNLDFDKYEMTFVGNSPIEFKNIKYKKPMNSEDLSTELKQNDIFFTASQKDPCSNSLIEALHCGLPAIGFNDGGHPEIISSAGKVFNEKEEILSILEEIVKNYEQYQQNIELPSLDEVGKKYFEFLEAIYKQQQNKQYKSKSFNLVNQLNLNYTLFLWKISEKFNSFKNRLNK